jgi:hypothetical protein
MISWKNNSEQEIDLIKPASQGLTVADVRVGLDTPAYVWITETSVWHGPSPARGGSCTRSLRPDTGRMPAVELLDMLASGIIRFPGHGPGLCNALAPSCEARNHIRGCHGPDVIQPSDHVVMVGFFGPLWPE